MTDKCPYIVTRLEGEENIDYCKLAENRPGNMHVCLMVSGARCLEWERIQKEEKE